MAFSLPHPVTLVDLVFSAADKALTTAVTVASAPVRLARLLENAETLVERATTAVDSAQQAIDDVRSATAAVSAIVAEAARTTSAAGALVRQAAQTADTAQEMIGSYAPVARKFIENLSSDEVDAAIRMTDELPKLAHHLNDDVLPILSTLDRVGPDIHELLGVTRDVRQAISGIPGFGKLRRRGEDKDDQESR